MIFFKINDVCLFLFERHCVVQYISIYIYSFMFEDINTYIYNTKNIDVSGGGF